MGNTVAFDKDTVPLDSIRWSKLKKDVKEPPADHPYNSAIFVWQFSYRKNNPSNPVPTPVMINSSFKLETRSSFVVLHVYKVSGKASPLKSLKDSSLSSLQAFLQSARDCLTPRGLSQTIGTTSKQYVPAESLQAAGGQLLHDFYIWNGRDSHPLARAGSLAGALKAEKKLKKKHYSDLLRALFYRESLCPSSSVFSVDVDPDDDVQSLVLAENRLFSQVLYQTISGYVQFLPSSTQLESASGKPFPPTMEDILPLRSHSAITRTASGSERTRPVFEPLTMKAGMLAAPQQPAADAPMPRRLTGGPGSLPGPVEVNRLLRDGPSLDEKPEATNWQALQRYFLPICSKINDFLYLGSRMVAESKPSLEKEGITHILNCAGTVCSPAFPGDYAYRVLYLADGPNQDMASLFYEVLDWIEAARQKNGHVFVHCEKGISRSSTMAICYLMWKNNKGFYPTHEEVKKIRDVASPNPNFTTQLLAWWERRRKAPTTTRAYNIEPHCTEDPVFVPKLVHDPKFSALLTPQRCVILEKPDCFYVWNGSASPAEARAAVSRILDQFRRYETAAPSEVKTFSDTEPGDVTAETLAIKP
uniref:Predicted protein n=1 Tax=Hordeum vulgare subsp. vulgare TaxID=112509 RepID=F2E2U0_HORVV|nr:predicted protein [Hordeum vulgare subsp. vulgare]